MHATAKASTPVPSMNVENTKWRDWWEGAAERIAMTKAVVPTACHHTEILFKYLSRCTPKVLMVPARNSFPVYA